MSAKKKPGPKPLRGKPKMIWVLSDEHAAAAAYDHPEHSAFLSMKNRALSHTLADPYLHEPGMAMLLATTLKGVRDSVSDGMIGRAILNLIADCTADELECKFQSIVAIKRQMENVEGRSYYAVKSYFDYVEVHGVNPTKRQLRRYVLDDKDAKTYRDRPLETDSTGWNRFWKDAGLDSLVSR